MKTFLLKADRCFACANDDEGLASIHLAKHGDFGAGYFSLCRDVAGHLGDPKQIYSEINDQAFARYGGIESASLENGVLRLRYSQEATRDLGGFHEVIVELKLDQESISRLAQAFDAIFMIVSDKP